MIAHGSIDTPRFRKVLTGIDNVDEFLTMLTSNMPMRRLGTADDIANAALFLASDRSAYTSGAIIPVDGGLSTLEISTGSRHNSVAPVRARRSEQRGSDGGATRVCAVELAAERSEANVIAIVTGGASGLGEAIPRRLASDGATVVVADIDDRAGQQVADNLTAAGLAVEAETVDVTDEGEVAAMVPAVVERHGRVDVLVCSATMKIRTRRSSSAPTTTGSASST